MPGRGRCRLRLVFCGPKSRIEPWSSGPTARRARLTLASAASSRRSPHRHGNSERPQTAAEYQKQRRRTGAGRGCSRLDGRLAGVEDSAAFGACVLARRHGERAASQSLQGQPATIRKWPRLAAADSGVAAAVASVAALTGCGEGSHRAASIRAPTRFSHARFVRADFVSPTATGNQWLPLKPGCNRCGRARRSSAIERCLIS